MLRMELLRAGAAVADNRRVINYEPGRPSGVPRSFVWLIFLLLAGSCLGFGILGPRWVERRAPATRPSPRSADAVVAEWGPLGRDSRSGVAREIVRDGHLIGLTPERVVELLGEPNRRRMSAEYGELKYIVGPSGVDDLWLCIHVENGRVVRCEIRSD